MYNSSLNVLFFMYFNRLGAIQIHYYTFLAISDLPSAPTTQRLHNVFEWPLRLICSFLIISREYLDVIS